MQDFQHYFLLPSNKWDQGFFFYGRLTSIFYCLHRTIVSKIDCQKKIGSPSINLFLKQYWYWAILWEKIVFGIVHFALLKLLMMWKESGRRRRVGVHSVTSVGPVESLDPFLESEWNDLCLWWNLCACYVEIESWERFGLFWLRWNSPSPKRTNSCMFWQFVPEFYFSVRGCVEEELRMVHIEE